MLKSFKIILPFTILIYSWQIRAQSQLRSCRVNDTSNSDVLFLALGNPNMSKIKQGDFDISNDRVLKDGEVVFDNFYKHTLGLKYFSPIDKSVFKFPATGWCSWYYYYQDLDLNETLMNTKWLGDNFRDFGLKYIQIDDAWQDRGDGDHNNRDWMKTNTRFRAFGMDSLAEFIRNNGFTPALWIVPHGQSNLDIARTSGAFMLDKKGNSTMKARWNWVGDYQIDPTSPAVGPYFNKLFSSFRNKGYKYFKVDGQSLILPDYMDNRKNFRNPQQDPIEAYRNTLKSIRTSVGDDVFLLGCWRTPVESIGYFNGSRSNGDIWASISGFGQVLEALRAGYFLHNTAWYVDPDPVMVGSPLSQEMAQVWASIIGLTGMSTFCTEKMQDLSRQRVDILKKIFPAQDIHPVDLFRYSKDKSIVDLKIGAIGRQYDVVGVFNYNAKNYSTTHLTWEALGLERDSYYHIYNFWSEEYVGCFNYGLFVNLHPASCKVLSVTKADTLPQLISTNRHITQGWLDVLKLVPGEAAKGNASYHISGVSEVIRNYEYKLVFALPQHGKTGYKIAKATFNGLEGKFYNSRGCGYVSFVPFTTEKVSWEVVFEKVENFHSPQKGDFPEKLKLTNLALNKLQFNFDKSYGICFGYLLERNGMPLGYSLESPIYLNRRANEIGATYTATETFNNFLLSGTKYSIKDSANVPGQNLIISNNEANGTVCYESTEVSLVKKGNLSFFGTGSKSFSLCGKFKRLTGLWKVENGATHYRTRARLEIWGDGRLLYRGAMLEKTMSSLRYDVSVDSVEEISFKVIFQQEGSDWGSVQINDIELDPI